MGVPNGNVIDAQQDLWDWGFDCRSAIWMDGEMRGREVGIDWVSPKDVE